MKINFQLLAFLSLSFLGVTAFQNCGGGFQVAQSLSSLSSPQCKAQIKTQASISKISARELHCDRHENYACERRNFNPSVKNENYIEKACLPTQTQTNGSPVCIDVDVRRYDTSGARTPENEAQFAPGGSYNREDIRCFHKKKIDNFLILDGEGDDIDSALAAAVRSCETAQGDDT